MPQSSGSLIVRSARVWRGLAPERRLAVIASIGLFLTLFLPWYQETVIATSAKAKNLESANASVTGWGAFSFVEAAVLLVSVSVLVLLFQRAEGKAFHLPGGDGWAVTLAGFWTCVLVIWRIFDKQGTSGHGQYATTSGIEWGIFVALAGAAFLAYAGNRIRAAHIPEPPLPGETVGFDEGWAARHPGRSRRAPRTSERTRVAPRDPREPRDRSSWRPADRPEWSEPEGVEPERRPGWLLKPSAEAPPVQPAPPAKPPTPPAEADTQLTMLDDEDY